MKTFSCALMCCLTAAATMSPTSALAAPPRDLLRPNILIIFTDDQGDADLACTGSKTNKTPRMDQLAKEGTRFTNFYAQSVCGPSRSALLTGRYPVRSGGWSMPASEVTWAELIRQAGYQTACIGKWDVSNRNAIIPRMPNAKGFDYYFGTLGANDSGSVRFHENNDEAGSTKDMSCLTKLYTDKAIDFLRKNPRALFKGDVLSAHLFHLDDTVPERTGLIVQTAAADPVPIRDQELVAAAVVRVSWIVAPFFEVAVQHQIGGINRHPSHNGGE